MASAQLHQEIIKNLDYSNSSKDRLSQLVSQGDQKITQALTTFVSQRETATSDSQKHLAMVQLKKDLDLMLFGKSATEYAAVTQTTSVNSYTSATLPQQSSSYTSYTPSTAYNNMNSNVTSQFSSNPTSSALGTLSAPPQYSAASFQPATAPQYSYSQTTTTTTATGTGNSAGLSEDYLKNLMNQFQQQATTPVAAQAVQQQQSKPVSKIQMGIIPSAPSSQYSGEETVKRTRKGEATEFDLDKRIQNIRTENKAKCNQELKVKSSFIKKDLMRRASFKELWVRGQPLVPELYKLFYDSVDDLDYASFLSLRYELHLDEVSIKDLVLKQQAILKQSGSTGINPEQFIQLMNTEGLQDDDMFSLLQIFFYLDFNNNGLLDTDEILLGFVLLASASEKEKIEAAFLIVDEDGSGTLDLAEMTKYMRSVIRMGDGRKFKSDDAFEHEFLVEKMAAATALMIFNEMDLDHSGRISYDEFVVWHNLHGVELEGFEEEKNKVKDVLRAASKDRSEKLMKYNAFTLQNNDYRELTNQRLNSVLDSKINDKSINQFRDSLHLNEVRFLDAVRFLKEHKVSERLGFGAFYNFMKELYERCQVKLDLNPIKEVLNEFYTAIDLDSNGFIDWNEILGAFSLLCVGTENEKIRGVFEVFDMNNDQVLQFNEVYTLFLSSFNLIFMRNPDSEIARSDPKKLAFSMSISAFSDNQLDPYTNGLDFETFVKWYRNFDMI